MIDPLLLCNVFQYVVVLRTALAQVHSVDLVELRLLMMDDVAVVVFLIEDVISWVNEDFHLVSDLDFKPDKSQASLEVKNHGDIFELQAFELIILENHSVKLVFSARFVV